MREHKKGGTVGKEREKQSSPEPSREPDAELNPRALGSRPEPKADP